MSLDSPASLQLDGAQLAALQMLLREASVSVAARRLETTQPALSRTLGRLRELFGDPLLVALGRTMELTPFAQKLAPRVDRALTAMRDLFDAHASAGHAPADEARTVTIAASDYATVAILEPWLRHVRTLAPRLVLRVVALSTASIGPLADGELDLAIGPRLPLPGVDHFVYRELLVDPVVCVVRRDHPRARRRLTIDEYVQLAHIMIGNDRANVSAVHQALHRLGKTRHVAATVPTFLSALHLVWHTDLTATLPRVLVQRSPIAFTQRTLPFAVEPMVLHLIWQPRRTSDPWHRWLRETFFARANPTSKSKRST